jgi:Zn-finger nucleic acid-binding protein
MNCPNCGAALVPAGNRNYFLCTHCGGYHFPEDVGDGVRLVGESVGANCPVCRLPLLSALIDGETVCYCDHCRGFLAPTPIFAQIVSKRRALHSPHEQRPGPFDPAELKRALKCPNCHLRMDTHPYFGGGNAVVDTCERCGLIWLDAGELAIIERYVPHVRQVEPPLPLSGVSGPPDSSAAAAGGFLGALLFGGDSPLDDLF